MFASNPHPTTLAKLLATTRTQCHRTITQAACRRRPLSAVPAPIVPLKQTRRPIQSSSSRQLPLGIRSTRPPDLDSQTHALDSRKTDDPEPAPEDQEITDQEWELRTGRAIYVLTETLPKFFDIGLVSVVDKATGDPKPDVHFHLFHIPLLEGTLPLISPGKSCNPEEEERVYSANVRLEYTPPVALPAPFPKTFNVEGLPLYLASAGTIRHAMNALYSDLTVTLAKVSVHTTPPPPPPSSGDEFSTLQAGGPSPSKKEKKVNREKYMIVRQLVTGTTRVGGSPSEWEVESMYTFSPISGLIWKHTVNSIHPAPHLAVYDSLRLSLGKVFGFGQPAGPSATASSGGAGAHNGDVVILREDDHDIQAKV